MIPEVNLVGGEIGFTFCDLHDFSLGYKFDVFALLHKYSMSKLSGKFISWP